MRLMISFIRIDNILGDQKKEPQEIKFNLFDYGYGNDK